MIPPGRLSPQAQALLAADSACPTPPGRDNGTRDNFVASGSEAFEENSFNVRIDGRISDSMNTFGRYSIGRVLPGRPDRVRRTAAGRSW